MFGRRSESRHTSRSPSIDPSTSATPALPTATESSPRRFRRPSPVSVQSEGWDADDEGAMSTDSSTSSSPPPPLTIAIPPTALQRGTPSHPQRPSLKEILANTSPAPWTLPAFMAYLSNNHCLETLEFTMDAARYKKHYAKMTSRAPVDGIPPAKDREYVQALWQRLVEAYIQPNGSREVNLPSDVRDPIINLQPSTLPPPPETLDRAVAKIYELMEESVLMPFLNSVGPQSNATSIPGSATATFAPGSRVFHSRSMDSGRMKSGQQQHESMPGTQSTYESTGPTGPTVAALRKSAPTIVSSPPLQNSKSRQSSADMPPPPVPSQQQQSRSRQPSSNPAQQRRISPLKSGSETAGSSTGGTASSSGLPGMTDDSGSSSSPTGEMPPTPPMSDAAGQPHHPHPKRDMWKKFGRIGTPKVSHKKSRGELQQESNG